MEKFIVQGPCRLKGSVEISGSKNASLPILAATLLFDDVVELKNLPNVKDIYTMLSLLESLGSKVKINKQKKIIKIYKSKKIKTFASYNLVKTMRAGILVLGPLIAKYKQAITSLPGGCSIGARPVNHHLNSLKKMGMKYFIKKGYIHAKVDKTLTGNLIRLPKISVGATENLIIASCLAKGKTIIKNCAIEPEIKDLSNFLIKAGAKIRWIGKRTVEIIGVKSLRSISYNVMGDRIECGTFCVAAALTEGNLKIKGFNPKLINTELNILKQTGAKIQLKKDEINIKGNNIIKNIKHIKTKEYPAFPTDLQAAFMVLLCKAKGRSIISENIFENRFMHVSELKRMGANLILDKKKVKVKGKKKIFGAEVMATDLRASSSLIIAGLMAEGKTLINRVYHLDRGYENIEEKLKRCGALIERIK